MQDAYKPTGYTSLAPYFVVDGAERFIGFLEAVFDAQLLRRFDAEDGRVMHAEARIDDTVIMFGDASDEHPARPLLLHLYTPDCDAVYERALRHGCIAIQAPSERPGDPDRRGGFRDFAGNAWYVATLREG